MKGYSYFILGAILAAALAIGIAIRVTMQKAAFNRVVHDALETSEGYDERFINMVNKLEEELATRASFGYAGKKDPMTGNVRSVVVQRAPVKRVAPAVVKQGGAPQAQAAVPEQELDPVKLTAIIFDDEKKHFTAIVMDGERSYSVEVGDRVRDRQITKIDKEVLFMESASIIYRYDVYGNTATKAK
jgi:hypothetical protein